MQGSCGSGISAFSPTSLIVIITAVRKTKSVYCDKCLITSAIFGIFKNIEKLKFVISLEKSRHFSKICSALESDGKEMDCSSGMVMDFKIGMSILEMYPSSSSSF